MSQSIKVAGASYPSVPYILIPKSDGSGNALYADTSPVTAAAADVAKGKVIVDHTGAKVVGSYAAPLNYLNALFEQNNLNNNKITTIDTTVLPCFLATTNSARGVSRGYAFYGMKYITSINLTRSFISPYNYGSFLFNEYDFASMPNLQSIIISGVDQNNISSNMIVNDAKLTTVSISLTHNSDDRGVIDAPFINNCPMLGTLNLDVGGITNMSGFFLQNCPQLDTINLSSYVTSMASNAFQYVTNTITINIDRAQSAITGAPWGAANATINWIGTT